MENYIIIAVLVVIIGAIIGYLIKRKKQGAKCIGCPYANKCSGCCNTEEKE